MQTERVLKKNATKAYKAFNSDLTCKDFQYEVGKEYHHKGKLELCESGFHACPKLTDCFYFYPFNKTKTRVAEVLVWGKVKYEDAGVKLCASNIKVVRELAWSEVLSLCNIGDSNTGYVNSGNHNTGDWNSGSWNSGNGNSGYWNIGGNNSGYLNTSTQEYCFIFNKPVEKSVLSITKFPAFMRFTLTEWIPDSKMSQQEKNQHPEYATTGGYLKKYTYKEAFRKSFEEAKQLPDWPEQLEKLKSLPNFDAKIFEEISGITTEELGVSDEDLAAKSTVTIEVTMADLEQKYGCKIKIVKEK